MYGDPLYWLYLSIAAFLTGIISSMGGSGGLVMTPFLIATGVPIHLAIGSAKASSLGMWGVTLFQFNKASRVQWGYVPLLSLIGVIGALIGSNVALVLDKQSIYPVVGLSLLLIAPIGLMKKNLGLSSKEYGRKRHVVGHALFFCISIFGGFFGAGTGTLAMLTLVSCMGLPALSAYATFVPAWMFSTLVSTIIFAWHGQVNYILAFIMFFGMIGGGWIGAKLAIKGSDKFVKIFTFSFAFLVGLKMLWESL
ncbi:MAG: sulfite exporter TauE/SafE family protein [Alphaproteobacteria bacterium]